MGANAFLTTGIGATLNEAFTDARDQAIHEHGHGGYSGSLAEKPHAVPATRQVMWLPAAKDLAHQKLEANEFHDKWGDAGAIPFVDSTYLLTVSLTEVQFPLTSGSDKEDLAVRGAAATQAAHSGDVVERWARTMTTTDSRGWEKVVSKATYQVTMRRHNAPTTRTDTRTITYTGSDVHAAAQAIAKPRKGETVTGIRVISNDPVFTLEAAKVTPGKTTRYVIPELLKHSWRHGLRDRGTFSGGFDTLAEARAWLKANATDLPGGHDGKPVMFTVEAVTRRPDDSALLTMTRRQIKGTATTDIDYTIYPPVPATPDGWLFFGWASS